MASNGGRPAGAGQGDEPILHLRGRVLPAGIVKQGTSVQLRLMVGNLGPGSLTGTVQAAVPWLSVPERFTGDYAPVPVEVVTRGLAKGQVHVGQLTIASNGGPAQAVVVVGVNGGFLQPQVDPRAYDLVLAREYTHMGMWHPAIEILQAIPDLSPEAQGWLRRARAGQELELDQGATGWADVGNDDY
jgi:hypothetical protein